jgi:hypothetical protein
MIKDTYSLSENRLLESAIATNFGSVAHAVLSLLSNRFGFDLWMVTRIEGENWIVLQAKDKGYGVKESSFFGKSFPPEASFKPSFWLKYCSAYSTANIASGIKTLHSIVGTAMLTPGASRGAPCCLKSARFRGPPLSLVLQRNATQRCAPDMVKFSQRGQGIIKQPDRDFAAYPGSPLPRAIPVHPDHHNILQPVVCQ